MKSTYSTRYALENKNATGHLIFKIEHNEISWKKILNGLVVFV